MGSAVAGLVTENSGTTPIEEPDVVTQMPLVKYSEITEYAVNITNELDAVGLSSC